MEATKKAKMRKPRTVEAALAEAVKVVGKKATVQETKCFLSERRKHGTPFCVAHGGDCPGGVTYYLVGRIEMGGIFNMILGQGYTWEEALSAAEEHIKHDRYICEQLHKNCAEGERLRQIRAIGHLTTALLSAGRALARSRS